MSENDIQNTTTKTLLHKKLNRYSIKEYIYSQINELTFQNLNRLARFHIGQNRKQLAVPSFDFIGTAINVSAIYEKEELDLLFEWLQKYSSILKASTALDIGANIGNHSLYFSDFFASVHSFEPNFRTYKILSLNAELAENIICHNIGLSDIASEAALYINTANIGGSSVKNSDGSGKQSIIKLARLDEFSEINERISLMKIDVEGLEFEVINGAKNTIKINQPIILFEQAKAEILNGNSRCIELLRLLGYSNFASIECHPMRLNKMPWYLEVPLHALKKIFFGGYKEIVMRKDFEKKDYAFIIAIPDWVAINSVI